MFLAFLLESRFTKREILKLYLDRAYLGGGAFGVEAASQFYFGKSVRDVNLAEAAMMAGLFKAPSKFAPHVNLPASRARTNDVLTNLVEAGYMSAGQVQAARLNPAKIIDTRPAHSPDWFLDWAFEEAQRLAEGRGYYVLTARTTVDLGMQQAAQDALVNTLRHTRVEPPQGLHRGAGVHGARRRRARHGGRPRLRGQPVQPRRPCPPPARLLLQALRLRHGLRERLQPALDRARLRRRVRQLGAAATTPAAARGARWPAIDAFSMSLNVPAVDLSLRVGREKVLEMTQRLGVDGVKKTCSMALGDTGITPLQHTAAYAHFANGGKTVQALRHPRDLQLQGRPDLLPRPRRAAAGRRS